MSSDSLNGIAIIGTEPWQLITISAKSREALERTTDQLATHLREHPEQNFADIAFTLQEGRKAFEHRRMAVCRDASAAVSLLKSRTASQVFTSVTTFRRRPVAFLFPGLGDQYLDMGRGLYESEPEFARHVDYCSELLQPLLGVDLRKTMYPERRVRQQNEVRTEERMNFRNLVQRSREDNSPPSLQEIHRTLWAQPALFVIEYALAKLWMSWGIVPEIMMGYSIGEYVAACLAGVISLEDSLCMLAVRAQRIEALPPGAMLAVAASGEEIRPLLTAEVSVTGNNGESLCVVAGTLEAVDALQQRLVREGELVCRRLLATHAFHSPLMMPVAEELTKIVRSIRLSAPAIPYISNVTGKPITDAEATDATYWARHLTQPVQFAAGLEQMCTPSAPVFMEIGPGQMLTSLTERYLSGKGLADRVVLPSLPHSSDAQPDRAFILSTLGNLWLAGIEPDWAAVHCHERRSRVLLPRYPCERQEAESVQANAAPASLAEEIASLKHGARPKNNTVENSAYAVRDYQAPVGKIEKVLAGIWAEVLSLNRVGRQDNFFRLGGNSLQAMRVSARLLQELGVEVSLQDLFFQPVLADMACVLTSKSHNTLPNLMKTKHDEYIPLSLAQQRLWFLAQMDGVSQAYHVQCGWVAKGKLDRTALRRALDRILLRHESLRTTFIFHDEQPLQRIASAEGKNLRFDLLEHDLHQHSNRKAELQRLVEEEGSTAFDLEAGPLIRGRLMQLEGEEHVLLITMHHIVSDGWSIGVLVKELNALYEAYVRGEDDPLAPLPIQYGDYAVWQRQWMEGETLRAQGEYWKKTLGGAPELLELPLDQPRPAQQDFSGGLVELVLEEELARGLRELSQRHGATLYMTLLAGWVVLLGRLSGQEEVVTGTPVANRGRAEIEGLIGFFVNTLALRVDLSGSPKVSELLERVKQIAIEAQQHQDIPFEQVVELLQPVRSLSHAPLLQVMFTWQNEGEERLELSGVQLEPLEQTIFPRLAKFDLRLALAESSKRIIGRVEYATALFEEKTVERYVGYFRRLLAGMVADSTQKVHRLPMLTEAERWCVLYEWNRTAVEYPDDKCIHQLLEDQVARTPENTAVVLGEDTLNYAELNRRTNRLAHYLIALGVEPDDRVAICAERSLEMIVAQLAVLKAGGTYVPLDPANPAERLLYMLQDTAPRAVITQQRWSRLFTDFKGPLAVLNARGEEREWSDHPDTNPNPTGLTAEHLAYVMYTSGSTGTPKAAMITHRAIRRLVLSNGYAEFKPTDKVALVSNPAFDAATMEVWAPLLNGGCAVVVEQSELLEPERLRQILRRHAVSILWLTVGLFNQYAEVLGEEFSHLRYLLVGGDKLDPGTIARVLERNPPQHLLNGYGPTETTTFAATYEVERVEKGRSIPIGRPISNTRIYILDAELQPVPIAVAGELYIGGEGVARGYLNQPALTADRFLPDPFVRNGPARMYKTGDIGRWLADGTIEFLGRNDFQIKVRGFRIELGEIEARLAEHEAVGDVVVVAREDVPGDKRLVAYYSSREGEGQAVEPEQLRNYLAARLPEYMVPTAYVRLAALPLNPNGKLDRKALPVPEADAHAVRQYEAPVGEIENALAAIWADVLRLERVGRHDNFFELGGHSLLVMRVIARLRQTLKVEMSIRELFAQPVLANLARVLEGAARNALPPITRRQAQVVH